MGTVDNVEHKHMKQFVFVHGFLSIDKSALVCGHQRRSCFNLLDQLIAEPMEYIQLEISHGAPVIIEPNAVSQILCFRGLIQVVVVRVIEEQVGHCRPLVILIQVATGEVAFNQLITLSKERVDLFLPGHQITTVILKQSSQHCSNGFGGTLRFCQFNESMEGLGIAIDQIL